MSDAVKLVRIDKWLWAARFFKTRSLAKAAVEGGKVQVAGQRVKPSKDLTLGLLLQVRQGVDSKEIIITGLSEQRRGAPEAALMYQETPSSIVQREQAAAQRKILQAAEPASDGRPSKKQRRQIHRFHDIVLDL